MTDSVNSSLQKRPGCVTAYAILLGLAGSFIMFLTLRVFFVDLSRIYRMGSDQVFGFSYFWGSALILLSLAWGLWRFRNWARIGVIIFIILALIISVAFDPIGLIIRVPIGGYLIYWFASNDQYDYFF